MNLPEILKPIQADFEEWFNKLNLTDYQLVTGNFPVKEDAESFYDIPPDFQIGVVKRYFRERHNLEIKVLYNPNVGINEHWYYVVWNFLCEGKDGGNQTVGNIYLEYNIAFLEAITKAVELVK